MSDKMTTFLAVTAALPSLIKTIKELMVLAEQAFGDKQGAEKKNTVMEAIKAMIDGDELWASLKNLFSGIINMLALFNFKSSGKDPETAKL